MGDAWLDLLPCLNVQVEVVQTAGDGEDKGLSLEGGEGVVEEVLEERAVRVVLHHHPQLKAQVCGGGGEGGEGKGEREGGR